MKASDAAHLYARIGKPAPSDIAAPDLKSKFNARKKEVDGILFDSAGEAEAYRYLKQDEAFGVISKLELQPEYLLQPALKDEFGKYHRAIKYRPDFRFLDCNGEVHVIDFKGMKTPVYALKRKLLAAKFPGLIFEEWTRATLKGRR